MTRRLVLVLLMIPTVAAAQPAKDAAAGLDPFYVMWTRMRDDPGSRASMLESKSDAQPADCDAAIANARKAGLKDDDKIYGKYARDVPEYVDYDDNKQAYITLADSAKLCARYRGFVLIAPAAKKLAEVASKQDSYSRLVKPGELDGADSFIKDGKDCLEAVDTAIKSGAPPDVKVKIFNTKLSLTEGRTKVCQLMIDWATGLGGQIKAAKAADREKRAAPYKALGVDGKKLDLFLEYDDVYWRGGKDCQRITDLKQLATARALFHWLENPDGTHTIRKYTFNGNSVSGPTSKTFRTAGAAQAACR